MSGPTVDIIQRNARKPLPLCGCPWRWPGDLPTRHLPSEELHAQAVPTMPFLNPSRGIRPLPSTASRLRAQPPCRFGPLRWWCLRCEACWSHSHLLFLRRSLPLWPGFHWEGCRILSALSALSALGALWTPCPPSSAKLLPPAEGVLARPEWKFSRSRIERPGRAGSLGRGWA